MKGWGIGLVVLLLVGAVMAVVIDRRVAGGFESGEPFPTIAFPSLADGRPTSIAAFRGKKIILHVFASW